MDDNYPTTGDYAMESATDNKRELNRLLRLIIALTERIEALEDLEGIHHE